MAADITWSETGSESLGGNPEVWHLTKSGYLWPSIAAFGKGNLKDTPLPAYPKLTPNDTLLVDAFVYGFFDGDGALDDFTNYEYLLAHVTATLGGSGKVDSGWVVFRAGPDAMRAVYDFQLNDTDESGQPQDKKTSKAKKTLKKKAGSSKPKQLPEAPLEEGGFSVWGGLLGVAALWGGFKLLKG